MKKKIFSLFVALMATVAVQAQIISVVSPSGATSLYRTLPEAIEGAQSGSVVYLPGGSFTTDTVKIRKKLTIIGVGHRANGDNVDGITTISGDLYFAPGSDGSAVMACYFKDNIFIGNNGGLAYQVNDIFVNRCILNRLHISHNKCSGIIVKQNYIRSYVTFGGATGTFTNNIVGYIDGLKGGVIRYNIFTRSTGNPTQCEVCKACFPSLIANNIFVVTRGINFSSDTNVSGNMGKHETDELFISSDWNDVFVNYNNATISPASDFHFKDEYKQYESQVGIYAGEGFDDSQLAPVPHIIHKDIDEKTDAAGKLKVRIRVKASE